jgi:hypothetical protein
MKTTGNGIAGLVLLGTLAYALGRWQQGGRDHGNAGHKGASGEVPVNAGHGAKVKSLCCGVVPGVEAIYCVSDCGKEVGGDGEVSQCGACCGVPEVNGDGRHVTYGASFLDKFKADNWVTVPRSFASERDARELGRYLGWKHVRVWPQEVKLP